MEIQTPQSNHGAAVSQVAKDKTPGEESHGAKVSDVAHSKSARQVSKDYSNALVLAAQEEVSLSSGNKAMALLYRAAIEAIDEYLAPTMGDNATQKTYEQGVDTSPEATADRIVDFSTQFFSLYQQQNSSLGFDEQLNGFIEVIGSAIDQGFGEAKDILEGLQVLEGDIAADVEETYSLVQAGLQEFKDSFYPDKAEAAAEPE